MGFALEYDASSGVVRWSLEGKITDEVFTENLRILEETLATVRATKGIVDLSAVTSFRVSNRALAELAGESPILPGRAPRVIVAPKDSIYGVARMFTMLSEETRPDLQVVRTMEEAYELLGIRSPKFCAVGLKKQAEV